MTVAGYHIVDAADGPTALKLLETSARFDLLITDLGLPGGLTGEQLRMLPERFERSSKSCLSLDTLRMPWSKTAICPAGSRVLAEPFPIEAVVQKVSSLLPVGRDDNNLPRF